MKPESTQRHGTVEEFCKEYDIPVLPASEKPIPIPASVEYENFNLALINLVNGTHLPKFCIIPVFADILSQLREAARAEYERDYGEWQKKLRERKNDTPED